MLKVEQTEFWSDPGAMTSATPMPCASDPEVKPNPQVLPKTQKAGPDPELQGRFAFKDAAGARNPGPEAPPGVDGPEVEDVKEEEGAPQRARAGVACTVYAHRANRGPRFNMARFLSLTGSLDWGESTGRWFVLPRRRFRARLDLGADHALSNEFLKDVRSPPRSYSVSTADRPRNGWMR